MIAPRRRIFVLLLTMVVLIMSGIGLWFSEPFQAFVKNLNVSSIRDQIAVYGPWGPAAIVLLMAGAIVFTPIPSAPIALASGALYGHFVGTAYVAAGASLGAFIAFGVSRLFGREVIERRLGDRLDTGLLGSQNALIVTVFITRLLPFVSFDLISYAAGLTCLHFWRFAIATLIGIVPASFVLAHFGGELVSADAGIVGWAVLGLGLVTGLPLIGIILKRFGEK